MSFFTKEVIKEVEVEDTSRIEELERKIKILKEDHESEERLAENEFVIRLSKATRKKEEENIELKEENAVLKSKVEILEKAFENMGFDVKDMKDILNKLVDGIVSKNGINVIK